jgi:hypothetical protein
MTKQVNFAIAFDHASQRWQLRRETNYGANVEIVWLYRLRSDAVAAADEYNRLEDEETAPRAVDPRIKSGDEEG